MGFGSFAFKNIFVKIPPASSEIGGDNIDIDLISDDVPM
jgi:hypothetical protein